MDKKEFECWARGLALFQKFACENAGVECKNFSFTLADGSDPELRWPPGSKSYPNKWYPCGKPEDDVKS